MQAPQVQLKAEETATAEETYGQREAKKLLPEGKEIDLLGLSLDIAKAIDTAQHDERSRILTVLLKNQLPMLEKYKVLVRHTGGYIQTSLAYVYSKALNDVFKLIAKGAKDDEQKTDKQA